MAIGESEKAKVRAYLEQISSRGGPSGTRGVIYIGAPDVAFKLSLPREDVVGALRDISQDPRSDVTPMNMILFSCGETEYLLEHIDPRNSRCPVHGQCLLANVTRRKYFRFQFHTIGRTKEGSGFPASALAESPPTSFRTHQKDTKVISSAVELSAGSGGQISQAHIVSNVSNVTNNYYGSADLSERPECQSGEQSMSDTSDSKSSLVVSEKQSPLDERRQVEGEQANIEHQHQRGAVVKIGATGKSRVAKIKSNNTNAEIVAGDESAIEDVILGEKSVDVSVEPWYKTKEAKIAFAAAAIGVIGTILVALFGWFYPN
ncbi:hypothetical protein L6R49_18835 [Myxococcota bacterium]|nr:hypothetical protein [Myxococcota bacterium]